MPSALLGPAHPGTRSLLGPAYLSCRVRGRSETGASLGLLVLPPAPQPRLAAPHPTSFDPVAPRLSRQERECVGYPLLRSQSAAAATAGPQPESRPRHRRRRRRHLRPAWSTQPRLPSPPPPSTALGNPPSTATQKQLLQSASRNSRSHRMSL